MHLSHRPSLVDEAAFFFTGSTLLRAYRPMYTTLRSLLLSHLRQRTLEVRTQCWTLTVIISLVSWIIGICDLITLVIDAHLLVLLLICCH